MDEKDWLILKTLHEKRNITQTAAAVFLSQPALSKRLRQMETRFGMELALRNQNGVELTPAGEYLAASSHEMLNRMRAIAEHLADLDNRVRGTLRLGASFFCLKFFLPDLLMRFKEQYPEVEFQITGDWSSRISRQVATGDLHIGFIRNDSLLGGNRHLLFRERTFICSARPLRLEDLPDVPQISYESDHNVRAELDRWWNEQYTRPPRVAMVVDRVDTSVEMVSRGLGYAFLSEFSASLLPGLHRYEVRFKNGDPYCRNTWVVPNGDALRLGLVTRFMDFVTAFNFPEPLRALQPRHEG